MEIYVKELDGAYHFVYNSKYIPRIGEFLTHDSQPHDSIEVIGVEYKISDNTVADENVLYVNITVKMTSKIY